MASPLETLSTGRKVLLGAAIVLLIDSFLPWYHASVSFAGYHASASASGWHQLGVIAWLFVIVLLVVEGARIAGALPLDEARSELASLAAAALVLLFGIIFVIQRISDGHLGFGWYVGVVGLIALAYGAYDGYKSGNAAATIKSMQNGNSTEPPAAS
jgi:hypothetical protein